MIILTFPSLLRRGQKIHQFLNHPILRRFSLQKLYNSSVNSASLKVSLLMNFKVTYHSSTTHPFHTHQNGSRTNVTFATMSSMTPFTLRTIWWSCTVSPLLICVCTVLSLVKWAFTWPCHTRPFS